MKSLAFIVALLAALPAQAQHLIAKGAVDQGVIIRIVDEADGTPETGVLFDTSGLDLEYRRDGAASLDIVEATLGSLAAAHSDGGFLHIGNGYYRVDLVDAAVATGANKVLVHGTVPGMVVIGCVVQLTGVDVQDGVRFGMTALPTAIPGAGNGLITAGTGANQISLTTGLVVASDTQTIGGFDPGDQIPLWVTESLETNGLHRLVRDAVSGVDQITNGSIIARMLSKSATADFDSFNNQTDSLEAQRDNIGTAGAGLTSVAAQAIAPTSIAKSRTWRASPFDASKAENQVTVKAGFSGTLAVEPALNPDADIDSFDSVTITDPEDDPVVATTLVERADGKAGHFNVPALTVTGRYTVIATVTTLDGQELPMECTLIVR